MRHRRPALTSLLVVISVVAAVAFPAAQASGAPKCRGTRCADVAPPAVAITTPAAGSSVSGVVGVSGTASDNVAVSSVSVSVDKGPWTTVSGTSAWNWSWSTTGASNGSHTLSARAVDSSGNATTVSVVVNVANAVSDPTPPPDTIVPLVGFGAPAADATVAGTVAVAGNASDNSSVAKVEVKVDSGEWTVASGTSSWSWSWVSSGVANGPHTLTARATDSAGNTATTTRSVTVSNPTTSLWTSPEGVRIDIRTAAGGWTPESVYSLLTANARDLSRIGPGLTVVVQDKNPTFTTIAASSVNGSYSSVTATMQLDARAGSAFSNYPATSVSHEYGHVWINYWCFVKWQGDWSAYLNQRWSSADGAVTLATDPRTGTSYTWDPDEIAADDYRLLFGSPAAIAGRKGSLNQQIVDPRFQPGLGEWLLTTWAG